MFQTWGADSGSDNGGLSDGCKAVSSITAPAGPWKYRGRAEKPYVYGLSCTGAIWPLPTTQSSPLPVVTYIGWW